MKSKSFELHKKSAENVKQNKTYDFVNFYKPASESNVKIVEKRKSDDGSSKENETHATNAQTSRRERSPYKKKKKVKSDSSLNISQINVEDISVPHTSEMLNSSKVTSTPNINLKKNKHVKSIMKNSLLEKKSPDASTITVPNTKPKKRNKSVSFMLEETDEVVIKKSKSSESFKNSRTSEEKIYKKKSKTNNLKSEIDTDITDNAKNKTKETQQDQSNDTSSQNQDKEKKKHKKHKKAKAIKPEQEVAVAEQEADSINNNVSDRKIKKAKSKKLKSKSVDTEISNEKTNVKQELKPEIIAQDLQNLNIGDNPHTLTDLLDEMTVIDKNKRKKNKKSFRKDHPKEVKSSTKTEAADTDTKEEKEKVKWIKRKWNKDKKGLIHDSPSKYIIVENLPIKIMCSYKKVLMEHFTKFGLVKQVGIAELYSMEDPEVFTTTICFDSEDSVKKALEEDNTLFEGNGIRIKRQMPPTQTTLVVRCFANITDSALSSMFAGAGRIRNVRQVIKGRKSMCTAFIEFDGPDAVRRAMKLAEGVKVDRKKIFVSRYEVRNNHKKMKTGSNDDDASDASED